MRLSKADLSGRVNGNLHLRFNAKALTSFAGLELSGATFDRSISLVAFVVTLPDLSLAVITAWLRWFSWF